MKYCWERSLFVKNINPLLTMFLFQIKVMNFLTCAHISVIVCLTGAGLMTGRLDEAEEGGLGLKGADGVIAEEVE